MSLRWAFSVVVLGLVACSSDAPGSRSTAAPSTPQATTASTATTTQPTTTGPAQSTTTAATGPVSLTYTLAGLDGATPRGDAQLIRGDLNDETTAVWASERGVDDAFLMLRDVPAPSSTAPEGDNTATRIDAPSGEAWLVTDNGVGDPAPSSANRVMWWRADGRLWVVSNYGLTPERLVDLTLAIEPASGLPFVLPDSAMQFVGLSTRATYESARHEWDIDGSTLLLAVSNGGLAAQLDVSATAITQRVLFDAPGYEIRLPNGQINLIWPTGDDDRWGSMDISPPLASRVDEIAAAIVPL